MLRLLSNEAQHMVIIPSGQLCIEALPGASVAGGLQAHASGARREKRCRPRSERAELENLRLAARLASGSMAIRTWKKIVIERGVPVVVNSGGLGRGGTRWRPRSS